MNQVPRDWSFSVIHIPSLSFVIRGIHDEQPLESIFSSWKNLLLSIFYKLDSVIFRFESLSIYKHYMG